MQHMLNKIRTLRSDDAAVSPVIGVILMVAVTVVLAAVIGAFVFGIGDTLSDPAPNADIDFDYNADANTVNVTHDGGDTITGENTGELSVNADGDVDDWFAGDGGQADEESTIGDGESYSSGDALVDLSDITSGDGIELNWESPDGGSSTTLGDFEAP